MENKEKILKNYFIKQLKKYENGEISQKELIELKIHMIENNILFGKK